MSQEQNSKQREGKTKISYYLAWGALLLGLLGLVHKFFTDNPIPKKDDY